MGFTNTFDTATPAGSDDPTEADDRMREIKAALQERLAVEHVFALTGTEVSGANTGKHSDITCDSIVNGGDESVAGDLSVTGALDVTGDIDPTTFDNTNGGFLDEDDMASNAADKVASQQSIKAYADAAIAAAVAAVVIPSVSGDSDSATDSPITIGTFKLAWGEETISANTSSNISHGLTKCFSAWAIIKSSAGITRNAPQVEAIGDTTFALNNVNGASLTFKWWAIGR